VIMALYSAELLFMSETTRVAANQTDF
jgi:hypothetical protein